MGFDFYVEGENYMSKLGIKVWTDRLEEVRSQIRDLAGIRSTGASPPPLHRQDDHHEKVISILKKLLVCLNEFSEKQFGYFLDGFFGDNPAKKLTVSKKYPPEHVLNATLDQIEYDYWVISHALSQRNSGSDEVKRILQIADILGRLALQPAIEGGHLGNLQVITYLHKSPSIRVIPYFNIALVGIPPTVGSTPRDYLAIPHEVGHLIYWLGKVKSESSEDTVSISSIFKREKLEKNVIANRWIEEIFADIYGVSLAGPAIALSFQDLALQLEQDEFFEDDGDHPPPILRPIIYTKILNKIGYTNFADALKDHWLGKKGKLKNRLEKEKATKNPSTEEETGEEGNSSQRNSSESENSPEKYEFAFKKRDGKFQLVEHVFSIDPKLPLDKTKQIEYVVKSIYEKIHGNDDNQPWMKFGCNWWRNIFNDGTDVDTIYSKFEDKIEEFTKSSDFEDEVNTFIDELEIDPCVNYDTLIDRWIKEFVWVASEKGNNIEGKIPYTWLPIFIANGWTTEGPVSNPPGP